MPLEVMHPLLAEDLVEYYTKVKWEYKFIQYKDLSKQKEYRKDCFFRIHNMARAPNSSQPENLLFPLPLPLSFLPSSMYENTQCIFCNKFGKFGNFI